MAEDIGGLTRKTENGRLESSSQSPDVLYNVTGFRYSEVLSRIMLDDVHMCRPDASINEVAREMAGRGLSSCVIVDDERRPLGIVTERDMVRKVVARGCDIPEDTKIRDIMTPQPIYLAPNDTLFDALSILAKNFIKHLPIVDKGRVVGIITLRQLMKIRHSEPLVLIGELQNAGTVSEFRRIRSRLAEMALERLRANIDPLDIVFMLSHINTSIHKRLLKIAMDEQGGGPPAEFCFFLTGSHGRHENFLFPDQDFGVIIEDSPTASISDCDKYFREVSQLLSNMLDEVGFSFCTGGVMGQNDVWRRTVEGWKLFISSFLENADDEHTVRYATLIFDAAPMYGNRTLFDLVLDHAFQEISKHHNILRQMHVEEGGHKVPLGMFNWFITEKGGEHKGEIDMKRSALIFIVEAARILAVKHGVRETSTIARLKRLAEMEVLAWDEAESFENAYRVVLQHALRAQIENYLSGRSPGYYLNPSDLSARGRELLKQSFKAVSRLQDAVAVEFGELI